MAPSRPACALGRTQGQASCGSAYLREGGNRVAVAVDGAKAFTAAQAGAHAGRHRDARVGIDLGVPTGEDP